MKIEYSTYEYEFENGRSPKGYGYWGFSFEGYEFWASGTYGDAKRACTKEVRRLAPKGYTGTVTVKVLP